MILISTDSKYLFNAAGTFINVYSIASGELVYRLSHTAPTSSSDVIAKYSSKSNKNSSVKTSSGQLVINAICINPLNKYQLLSFHQNGTICLWDYEDGLFLRSFETDLMIKSVVQIETRVYALGQSKHYLSNKLKMDVDGGSDGDGDNSSSNNSSCDLVAPLLSLYKLNLSDTDNSKQQQLKLSHELLASNLTISPRKLDSLGVAHTERYAAFIESRKKLVVTQFSSRTQSSTSVPASKNNSNLVRKFRCSSGNGATAELTCLAMHPSEDCIATGTTSGRIVLWYNYLETNSTENSEVKQVVKPTQTILHWHALPVLSLRFSSEGSYLLSGGHECVLVKWLVGPGQTGQKDFKPRLAAPLTEIVCSKDSSLYVTRHADNTIHLIGTNLSVTQTVSSFVRPCISSNRKDSIRTSIYPTGLNYFEPLNCLVTNGKPGHLQFYSFTQNKLLFSLDVVGENFISPENLQRPTVHTEIECAAVTPCGQWLATVERRDDNGRSTPETRLKFWSFSKSDKKFTLNTLIRYPHSFEKVNFIRFSPMISSEKPPVLFTCGNDGCFKSWELTQSHGSGEETTETEIGNAKVGNEVASVKRTSWSWVYKSCNGYRSHSPTHIAFFENIVVVAFEEHIITVWKIDEESSGGLHLIADLMHCDASDSIRQLAVIRNSKSSKKNDTKDGQEQLHVLSIHDRHLNLWRLSSSSSKPDGESSNDLVARSQFSGSSASYVSKCVWSQSFGPNEQVEVLKKEDEQQQQQGQKNQLVLLFSQQPETKKGGQTASSNGPQDLNIQVKLFGLDDTDEEPIVSQMLASRIHSHGKVQFSILSKATGATGEDEIEKLDSKNFQNLFDIFYCDNQGFVQRLSTKSNDDLATTKKTSSFFGSDLSESMWQNRQQFAKNLPSSSLVTNIIDIHKTARLNANQSNDFNNNNDKNSKMISHQFQANLNKIELTPAYLMPKVGTFCYDTLKSMLRQSSPVDSDNNNNNNNSNNVMKNNNFLETKS